MDPRYEESAYHAGWVARDNENDRDFQRACELLSQAGVANDSPASWADWWGDVVEFLSDERTGGQAEAQPAGVPPESATKRPDPSVLVGVERTCVGRITTAFPDGTVWRRVCTLRPAHAGGCVWDAGVVKHEAVVHERTDG